MIAVASTSSARQAFAEADRYLAAEPVLNNIMLTRLQRTKDDRSRYWIARAGGHVVATAMHAPLDEPLWLSPAAPGAIEALAQTMRAESASLPGVLGQAADAARFAARWTEWHDAAAAPVLALRIYVLRELAPPRRVPGELRQATPADRDRLAATLAEFYLETGRIPDDDETHEWLDGHIAARSFWLWDVEEGLGSMAVHAQPVAGVARVSGVYTPSHHRRRGYAAACVSALSARLQAQGVTCTLHANLGNAAANALFRKCGYVAVEELLRYRFDRRGAA